MLVWACLNRLSGGYVFCLTPTGIQCLAIAFCYFVLVAVWILTWGLWVVVVIRFVCVRGF